MDSGKAYLQAIRNLDCPILRNAYGEAQIEKKCEGTIILTTGKIVIGDPTEPYRTEDIEKKMLSKSVCPGHYELWQYRAKTPSGSAPAFIELRFTKENPVKFVEAKTVSDAKAKRRQALPFVVSNNRMGLMDAEVFLSINSAPRFSGPQEIVEFDDLDRGGVGCSEDGTLTAAAFPVRSGIYRWYWGVDAAGQICSLTLDCFSV